MKRIKILFVLLAAFQVTGQELIAINGNLVDQDFENGKLGPYWSDDSQGVVHWTVNDEANIFEPKLKNWSGRKCAKVAGRVPSEFNPAVLRSPKFQAVPGDQISFAFWIRSRYPRGNNLQVINQVFYIQKVLKFI